MFGSEERHRVCHIIRLAHTAQRDALCHFRLNRFGQDSRHIRCNKAGGYRIDRNAAAGQLPGQALGQTDEACLAGGVVGLARIAPQGHHAAEVDDPARALTDHPAGSLLAAEERSLEVGVEDFVKILLAQPQDQIIPGDTGVVHEDIHPAKGVDRLFKQFFTALGGGDIGLYGHSLHAQSGALGHRLSSSIRTVAVVDHHIAALFGQSHADGTANAPAAAGDNGSTLPHSFAHAWASFHLVRNAASSSAVSTAVQGTSGPSVFLTKPLSALPGPTSRISVTPSSPRRRRVSSM